MCPHLARRALSLAFLSLAFVPTLAAQEIDGTINLGTSFEAAIVSAADVDVLLFEALAGELLTVRAAPAKKSGVVLRVDLFLAQSATLLTSATAAPKKVSLKKVELPFTGFYALTISGVDGTTGAYKLKTKGKPSKASLKPASEPGAGGGAAAGFPAKAGSLLTALIKPDKGSDSLPGAVTLVGPDGPLDLTSYTTAKGSSIKLKKVPLNAFGSWSLAASSVTDEGGLLIKAKVKPPKAAKTKLIEPKGPANPDVIVVLDPSIPLVTTSADKKMTVLGHVVDLVGGGLPEQLDWTTSGGLSGSFDIGGTGEFSDKVTLQAGQNVVTFAVPGTDVSLDLLVTHNPGYSFGGLLDVQPDVLYVGESVNVTARVALPDSKTHPDEVVLVRGNGVVLTQLKDDGDLLFGDEIQGDGVYSAAFDYTPAALGVESWSVVVGTNSGEAHSETFDMLVDSHLSVAEVALVQNKQSTGQAQLEQAVALGTVPQTVNALVAQLSATPGVEAVGKSQSGRGVWVVYESGIAGVMYAPEPGIKGGGSVVADGPAAGAGGARTSRAPEIAPPAVVPAPYDAYLSLPSAPGDGSIQAVSIGPQDVVQSNKALAIAAYKYEFTDDDEISAIADLLEDNGCFEVDRIEVNAPGGGDISNYKAMGEYGVICISTHGDSFFAEDEAQWAVIKGWDKIIGEEIILTNHVISGFAQYSQHEADIKKGRLIVLGDGELCFTSSFVRHYAGKLPNSLVYISACRSAWNGSLAQAFLGAGAGAYLGFTDYVDAGWAGGTSYWFFVRMLDQGQSVGEAYIFDQETDDDPAIFARFGSTALMLDSTGLKDASFETGDLAVAWAAQGDARVVPGLDKYGPKDGNTVAIISTGLGFTTDSGSIAQTFCMPAEADKIEFWWNFFSEEFTEYCGSSFQDSFLVQIADADTPVNTTTLLHTFIDDLCGGVTPVDIHFDQPDDPEVPGVFATGWRKTSVDVPEELKGRPVFITFACQDVGDSAWDSAVLIDAIKVE